jgi:predicted DNA-binding ribbon-helix-helix protein
VSARPVKRSLTLRGHRTSVSLEEIFWRALRAAAEEEGLAVNALAARIDAARAEGEGLASALRVWLFARASGGASGGGSGGSTGGGPQLGAAGAAADRQPAADSAAAASQPAAGAPGLSRPPHAAR